MSSLFTFNEGNLIFFLFFFKSLFFPPLLSKTFRILILDVELGYNVDTLGMSQREPEAVLIEVVDN